jgi:hypothetical protein
MRVCTVKIVLKVRTDITFKNKIIRHSEACKIF